MTTIFKGCSEEDNISPGALINTEFVCGKRYFDGQYCGASGIIAVVQSLNPVVAVIYCEDHTKIWGDKPFKDPRDRKKYEGSYKMRFPQIMTVDEFVALLIMAA